MDATWGKRVANNLTLARDVDRAEIKDIHFYPDIGIATVLISFTEQLSDHPAQPTVVNSISIKVRFLPDEAATVQQAKQAIYEKALKLIGETAEYCAGVSFADLEARAPKNS